MIRDVGDCSGALERGTVQEPPTTKSVSPKVTGAKVIPNKTKLMLKTCQKCNRQERRWLGEFLRTCTGQVLLGICLFTALAKGREEGGEIIMMHNRRGLIRTEGLEYRAGSGLRLGALKRDAIQQHTPYGFASEYYASQVFLLLTSLAESEGREGPGRMNRSPESRATGAHSPEGTGHGCHPRAQRRLGGKSSSRLDTRWRQKAGPRRVSRLRLRGGEEKGQQGPPRPGRVSPAFPPWPPARHHPLSPGALLTGLPP